MVRAARSCRAHTYSYESCRSCLRPMHYLNREPIAARTAATTASPPICNQSLGGSSVRSRPGIHRHAALVLQI